MYFIYAAGCHRDQQIPSTPLQVAAYFGLDKVLDILTTGLGQPAHQISSDGSLAIEFAARTGKYHSMQILESKFSAPREKFLMAIRGRILEVAKMLDARSIYGREEFAINEDHGCDYDSLLEAARHGHNDILKELLVKQPNLRAMSRLEKLSALDLAARIGNQDGVQMLVEAALLIRDEDGNTPLHLAATHGHPDVVRYFLDSKTNPHIQVPVNLPNKLGYTPLHLASMGGDVNTCQILLSMGASTHALSFVGDSPIASARKQNRSDMVDLLEEWKSTGSKK